MAGKKNSVTSKDVAKRAGVSQSTVSRVFMNSGTMQASHTAEKTRKKVLDAAKALNYRPNAFARSLTTKQSKLIGLVFPDTDYPIHMKTLQLISSELQNNGYSAVLIPWVKDDHQQRTVPNIFQYKVDGVISSSAQFNTALYEECQEFNIPTVQFAKVESGTRSSYAISDNYSVGRMAVREFAARGARRIAYITGEIPTVTNQERENGFLDEARRLGLISPQVIQANYAYEKAKEEIRLLLNQHERPDSIFCATDIIAIALMDVARLELGIAIPDELQIIGMDNIPQASWSSYQLCSFEQDFERLAKEAVKIVVDQIQEQDASLVKLMIPARLIERDTLRSK